MNQIQTTCPRCGTPVTAVVLTKRAEFHPDPETDVVTLDVHARANHTCADLRARRDSDSKPSALES